MNPYLIGAFIGLMLWTIGRDYGHDQRLTALESAPTKATAPATQPSASYQGEFAAERIAGHNRGPCTFKPKTERVSELHCIYVRPEAK